jgi:hypothetical protein
MSRSDTPTGATPPFSDAIPFDDVAPATIRVLADCGVLSDEPDEPDESVCSPDSAFKLLAHPGRRIVVTHLLSAGPTVTLSQLLDYVFSQSDTGTESTETRQEVTEAFTSRHLPKLDAEGYIAYDLEHQRITATDQTASMKPYLALAILQERPTVSDQEVSRR